VKGRKRKRDKNYGNIIYKGISSQASRKTSVGESSKKKKKGRSNSNTFGSGEGGLKVGKGCRERSASPSRKSKKEEGKPKKMPKLIKKKKSESCLEVFRISAGRKRHQRSQGEGFKERSVGTTSLQERIRVYLSQRDRESKKAWEVKT